MKRYFYADMLTGDLVRLFERTLPRDPLTGETGVYDAHDKSIALPKLRAKLDKFAMSLGSAEEDWRTQPAWPSTTEKSQLVYKKIKQTRCRWFDLSD